MTGLLSSPLRNLLAGICFLLIASSAAIMAYAAEGWPLGDAFFMVITTIFTVGYGEIRPVDTAALRTITISLIVTGCTGMIFVTGSLVQLITASQFQQILGTRRMQKDISAMADHVIICGFGRIGQMLASELRDGRQPLVVIERDEPRVKLALERGFPALQADATDEEVLRTAGIQCARVVATVLPNDAANVFITLSARSLNPSLTIIARGETPSTERKLLHAGANRVVMPAHIGAERVAELILFRDIAELLASGPRQAAFGADLRHLGLELEVIPAAANSPCIGMTLAALEEQAAGAFLIVALKHAEGSLLHPPPETIISPGDGIALVGRPGRAEAVVRWFTARVG